MFRENTRRRLLASVGLATLLLAGGSLSAQPAQPTEAQAGAVSLWLRAAIEGLLGIVPTDSSKSQGSPPAGVPTTEAGNESGGSGEGGPEIDPNG